MPAIAETPRLIIRTFKPEEEDAYAALLCDEQVKVHLPVRTADEIKKGFRDTIAADAEGASFSKWAIIDKADLQLAGMGLLRSFEENEDTLEVGYCLHVKYWGQGIATELTKALITYAQTFSQIKAVVAVTTPQNIASGIVLQKAGLVKQDDITRDGQALSFYKRTL